ncbi:hypothetical protein FPOA_12832 [Fusarium poae]|uniref:Uncharacterized protein n=1 Tax=Fusarium poae TaxID=36050 RepID=A0A1B8A7S9_FUSPO|nr:hypothetical protein FPOA_12832 [Fusarium poae]
MPKPSKPKSDEKSRSKKHGSKSSKSRQHSHRHGSTSQSHQSETGGAFELYCAIYQPRSGNYYHWAFAMYRPDLGWGVFEVVQDEEDGPFRAVYRQTDPRSSLRCLPLIPLGYIHPDHAQGLAGHINGIQVPGESALWNCQDYVLEIWDLVLEVGAIDEYTRDGGRIALMPYYGPIQEADDGENGEGSEDENDQPRQYQSAEYVYDSGSD